MFVSSPLIGRMLRQARWFQGPDSLDDRQIVMLRAMPIFPQAQTEGAQPALLDLLESRQLAPQGTRADILPGSSFICAESEAEAQIMVRHLGVRQLSRAEVLQQHVFTRWPPAPEATLAGVCCPALSPFSFVALHASPAGSDA